MIDIINSTNFMLIEDYKQSHCRLSNDILSKLRSNNIIYDGYTIVIEAIGNDEIQTEIRKNTNSIILHTKYFNNRLQIAIVVDINMIKYEYTGSTVIEYSSTSSIIDKALERLLNSKR